VYQSCKFGETAQSGLQNLVFTDRWMHSRTTREHNISYMILMMLEA